MGKNKIIKDWIFCNKCSLYVIQELNLHECNKLLIEATSFLSTDNGILCAKLETHQAEENVYKNHLLYMNNTTMEILGWHFLEPVLLNKAHPYFVIPNSLIKIDCISISKEAVYSFDNQSFVNVSKLTIPIPVADVCVFKLSSLSNDINKCSHLNNYIKQQFDKMLLKNSDSFELNILGLQCTFTVSNIITENSNNFRQFKMGKFSLYDNSQFQISPDDILISNINNLCLNEDAINYEKLLNTNSKSNTLCHINPTKNCYSIDSLNYPSNYENNIELVDNVSSSKYINTKSDIIQPLYYKIDSNTQFIIDIERNNHVDENIFGGYSKQKKLLYKIFNFISQNDNQILNRNFVPTGILLHGPPGIGKGLLVRSLSNLCNLSVFEPNIESFLNLDSESQIDLEILNKKISNSFPCVLFFENFERFFPSKSKSYFEINLFKRVILVLKNLLNKNPKMIIVGTTSYLERANKIFVSPKGLFTFKIEMMMPTTLERFEILLKIIENIGLNCKYDLSEVKSIAFLAHGYSSADLCNLANFAIKEARKSKSNNLEYFELNLKDLEYGLSSTTPSLMREIAIECPMINWEDVGGREELKSILRNSIQLPMEHPEVFERVGLRPPKGILLYGPPGCSKTMLAKAVATECKLNFISVQGSELSGKWVGDTERAISDLFRRARAVAPTVIFFDEIEAFALKRGRNDSCNSGGAEDRAVQQLLVEIDGVKTLNHVAIIAATNRPTLIDEAFLRPGRFDRLIYVSLPDHQTRKMIFEKRLLNTPLSAGEQLDFDHLADITERFSCSEVSNVVDEACEMALFEDINSECISQHHLLASISGRTPMTSDDDLHYFQQYKDKHEH